MRPEILNPLFRHITALPGVGEKTAEWLSLLCGARELDLLWHLPSSVRQRPCYDAETPLPDQLATFQFIPQKYNEPAFKRLPFRVIGRAPFGEMELVFFRYHWGEIEKRFPLNTTLWVSGKVQNKNGLLSLIHPDYVRQNLAEIPTHEVVYPLRTGAQNMVLMKAIQKAFLDLPDLPEWQTEEFLKSKGWTSFKQALFAIHHPETEADLSPLTSARLRLAYDELLANQLSLMIVRQKDAHQAGVSCPLKKTFKLNLPFSLTGAQERVLLEIRADLASPIRMCRLLQGDVGSGKTIVALLSALQVIENTYQVALMAPTDILARQHFQKIEKLLRPLGIKVALLTAREKGKKRAQILNALSAGDISLLVGTHALIEEGIQFKKLGLVIIDEQHRFGVNQRLRLARKQEKVNLLLMSATPIPRSLAMTHYGDMDISVLDEKPLGRMPITTRMMHIQKIPEVIQKLQDWPAQCYWVCPLVEESEKSDLMAVKERFSALAQVFQNQVGLVHGQMKGEEKERVMTDFVAGKIKILVSTTVIEVGVDVPNASLMIIEHAERFGLATLHQLRGRVGRGSLHSACLLLYGKLSETARKRLELLRATEDGFQIAEADLQMRGAGEILGWRQSGLEDFKLAQFPWHSDLLRQATLEAKTILKQDATLSTKRGQRLKTLLYLFEKDAAVHTLKAG
ncbi:MAG: ATP-dependent DNA helicase RecG [Alphaproteobacteria bacterium]